MAITKVFLSSDLQTIIDFLESSGLFASVALNDTVISCLDSDNNVLFTLNKTGLTSATYTAYVGSSNTVTLSVSNNRISYGYKCTNGIMLGCGYSGTPSSPPTYTILMAKTNNNRVAIIMPNSITSTSHATMYNCVTYYDALPLQTFTLSSNTSEQTLLSPLLTNAADGQSSYCPKAFYMPFGEYIGTGYAKFIMNGTTYLTDGYFAISDEEPTPN